MNLHAGDGMVRRWQLILRQFMAAMRRKTLPCGSVFRDGNYEMERPGFVIESLVAKSVPKPKGSAYNIGISDVFGDTAFLGFLGAPCHPSLLCVAGGLHFLVSHPAWESAP